MSTEGRTTGEIAARYRSEGYVRLDRFLDEATIRQAALEMDRAVADPAIVDPYNFRCRYHLHRETGKPVLESLDPVEDLSDAVHRLAHDPRLLALLKALLGDEPRLFKDKYILKPPGTNGYALHQDYIHWPGFPPSFTTVVLALDGATTANGCLAVYPGLHRKGCLSPLDGEYHDLPESVIQGTAPVELDLAPGDLAVFGCFMPHRSGPNTTPECRRQLYLSYNAAFDGGDMKARHYQEFHDWLRRKYSEFGSGSWHFR